MEKIEEVVRSLKRKMIRTAFMGEAEQGKRVLGQQEKQEDNDCRLWAPSRGVGCTGRTLCEALGRQGAQGILAQGDTAVTQGDTCFV